MFNLDHWREIIDTLWTNKLRSVLTAFSMAWGIFMLVFLLGMGNGLSNGVQASFADDATNSLWVFPGETSVPHQGLPIGRKLTFDNDDVSAAWRLPWVDHVTGRFSILNNWTSDLKVSAGKKVSTFDVRCVHPDHLYLEATIMRGGRFLNDVDVQQRAKVAVIGIDVATFLFDREDAIGRWITIGPGTYQVVGVFTDDGGEGERAKIYIPITTAQAAFSGGSRVHTLMLTVGDATLEQTKIVESRLRDQLARAHDFAATDKQALRVRNNVEQSQSIRRIFTMLSQFVWIMAAGTILAGVVGISNIMMIVVRERTKEIGIRKALGATRFSILVQFLIEAMIICLLGGAIGVLLGLGVSRLLTAVAGWQATVSLTAIAMAFGFSAGVGLFFGLWPARKAARMDPIAALRYE